MALKKVLVQDDPFLLIEEGHLTIKTKTAELVSLKLNKAQQKLHDTIRALWKAKKIIRIIILKARQLGMTTYIESLIYAITSQQPNINTTVISDDLDGSNYIFEMSKLFQEKIPPYLKTPTKRSNEKKLEFDKIHSQIIIDTADNKDAGRKYTFRIAHLSEYAFFKNVDDLMLGLSQAVPSMPQTIIVKETTANGYNFFKNEWDQAENGESDYIPVFAPWYWGEEYQMPTGEGFQIGDISYGDISRDEPKLYVRMDNEGIDNIEERLAWRRWCIRNNCGNGSDKQRVENFKQEYPSTPEEAFKASGDCWFSKDELIRQLDLCKDPDFIGNVVKIDHKYELREAHDGDFYVYEKPFAGGQYDVGGDACSGSGLDYSPLIVRRKDTNDVVAVFHGKLDPDELAEKAELIGHYYNDALVAIENDKFGFSANKKLVQTYGKVYYKESVDERTSVTSKKFGWDTNSKTRPMMLAQMQEEIREGAIHLRDKRLIKECLTFIKNAETGKVEAQQGCNDDLVIACAISGAVRQLNPYKKPVVKKKRQVNRPINGGMGF